MVRDAQNQHLVAGHTVENPMLAVNKAPNIIPQFGAKLRGERKVTQQGEGFVKAMHVDIGNLLAKSRDAEFVDLNQVGFGSV